MRFRTVMPVAALLAALLGTAGCNSQDAGRLASDTGALARDTGQALGSATLAGKVSTHLTLHKGVSMTGLHIEAKDGVVTVGGHVRNREERARVLSIAKETVGVDSVVDALKVEP